jgi:hypothetical protein
MTRRQLLLLSLGLPACAGGGHMTKGGALKSAVRRHNLAVRWQKWRSAAIFVHPSYRQQWMAGRVVAAPHVRITDVSVLGIQPGEDGDTATVMVGVSWHRITSTSIEKRAWQQSWRYENREWFMYEEKRPDPVAAPVLTEPVPEWP